MVLNHGHAVIVLACHGAAAAIVIANIFGLTTLVIDIGTQLFT